MNPNMHEKLRKAIELFQEKEATSKEDALTLEELGLPKMFKFLVSSPMGSELPFAEVNGKYYLDEESADAILKGRFPKVPFSNWVKQTGRVPRGYLRYRVLLMLRERPMAGSEISDQIEKDTNGRYRPSPGSIYPLLQKLNDRGIIEKLPVLEGKKRYELTELGEAFLDEQTGMFEEMRNRLISGPIPAPLFLELPDEIKYLNESAKGFFRRMIELTMELSENPDSDLAEDLDSILKESSRRIDSLLKRME